MFELTVKGISKSPKSQKWDGSFAPVVLSLSLSSFPW